MVETNRTKQLKALVGAFPEANENTARQLEQARQLQMRQTIGQAPAGAASTLPAQQLGAQQVAAQGAAQTQVAKESATDRQQVGALALQESGRQMRQETAAADSAAQKHMLDIERKLAKIDNNLKGELFDKQMEFKTDEANKTRFTETQLMDFALANARSDEDFAAKAQLADQVSKQKIQILKAAHDKINQQLELEFSKSEQSKNHAQTKILAEQSAALKRQIQAKQAEAKNKAAKLAALGMILGAVGGAAVGGPAGVSAGMAIGQGAANTLGGM